MLTADLLEPLAALMILPSVKKTTNWWGDHIWADKSGRYIYMFLAYLTETIWFNTKELRPEEVRSYDDLLNPKLKGRIAILDPRIPGSPISRQASRGTDVPVRIFLIPFFALAEFVIPD